MVKIEHTSDIAPLREVIVGPYKEFSWWDLIRGSLRYPDLASLRYARHNEIAIPDHAIAQRQHLQFTQTLTNNGVIVHELTDLPDVSIQLYPRDIAFAIDDTLFLARSKDPIRRREQRALDSLLPRIETVHRLSSGFIEGGDVIVTDDEILVGLSEATDLEGVTALRTALHERGIDRDVIPIEFSGRGVVHLDTKFTLVGPGMGFIHSAALTPRSRDLLSARMQLLEATEAQSRALMVNTVALTPERLILDERATTLIAQLRSHGLQPLPMDFSQVTRFPGGFRCATLPLRRAR